MAIKSILRNFMFSVSLIVTASPQIANATDYAKLYEEFSQSVVTINTKTLKAGQAGMTFDSGVGTGFLIEPTLVMTAAHVVDKVHKIQVKFKDSSTIDAEVIASIATSDVALLRLAEAPENPVLATLGDSDKAQVGEPVFVIGAPYGIEQTLSIGILSGRMNRGELQNGQDAEFLQTDTAINPGNSGGPMFNQRGEVIGIVSFILSKSGGFDGIGFASASNSAYESLLNSTGFWSGFEAQLLTPVLARALNIPNAGVLVQRVLSGSIADNAGLKAGRIAAKIQGKEFYLGGDIILEINGHAINKPKDLRAFNVAARRLGRGESYDIRIMRNGEEMRLTSEVEVDDSLLASYH